MNIKVLFRLLLLLPMVLLLIYALLPSVEYLWLSCDELSLLEATGHNAIIPDSALIFIIYMIVWLLISAGVSLFIKIARIVYAVFVFISVILLALVGNRVSAPVDNVLMFIMSLSVGAVLVLMYSASMREYFYKDEVALSEEEDDEERRR
jgi:hypothetical protein